MKSRSNFNKFIILGLISLYSLNGQKSGIQVLEEVVNNAMNIEDANYSFIITSENENNLFPITGELYIKKETISHTYNLN